MNLIKKWFKGVEISEVSLVLPFVQISLKPSAEEIDRYSAKVKNFDQNTIQQRQVQLDVVKDSASSQIAQGVVKVRYAYRIAERFLPVYRDKGYSSLIGLMLGATDRNFYDYPRFGEFCRLSGQMEVHSGDVVWFSTYYENISGRVLNKIPVSMGPLTFLQGLQGIAYSDSSKEYSWMEDITSSFVVEYINPDSWVVLNCFCRIPENPKPSKYLRLLPYLPSEPRHIRSQTAPKLEDYREYIKSVLMQQWST